VKSNADASNSSFLLDLSDFYSVSVLSDFSSYADAAFSNGDYSFLFSANTSGLFSSDVLGSTLSFF
jgi:hypothetical protein